MTTPTATPLRLGPQDMAAMAAACCYGRPDLREPEREAKMLSGLMQLDPPHLTLAEHARFTVELPRLHAGRLEELLALPRPPLYRWREESRWALLGLNVSHVRQIVAADTDFGAQLLSLLKPLVPALLDDLTTRHDGLWRDQTSAIIVTDEQMGPGYRRVFPSRSFLIRCSRAASHQLVRHRTISWEQRSQRYVDEGECDFIWPPEMDAGWCGPDALESYDYFRLRGTKREDARYVLPNATATTLIATGPMEAWRHFLRLRGERKAQSEIRFLAYQIHRALLADLPDAVEDLTVDPTGLDPWLAQE